AKQYVKFIPPAYLKNINFGKYLQNFNFTFLSLGGNPVNDTLDYNNPSNFTKQFFQNHPSKNKIVTLDMLTEKTNVPPLKFTLSDEFLQNNFLIVMDPYTGNSITTQTKFLSIASNTPKKY